MFERSTSKLGAPPVPDSRVAVSAGRGDLSFIWTEANASDMTGMLQPNDFFPRACVPYPGEVIGRTGHEISAGGTE